MKKLFVILVMLVAINTNAQWVQMSNGMGVGQSILALAVSGNTIFAGIDSYGICISTNNGTSWTQVAYNNYSIASLGVNGNNIFAGMANDYGVNLSTNNGTNWTQTSLINKTVWSLAINGNNIYAGTQGNGIYLSTNNGITWTQTALNIETVYNIAINGNNIFAGTYQNGIFRSTNNGINWIQTTLNSGTVNTSAANGNNIFAATSYANGVYLSTNNGSSWAQTSMNNKNVISLLINGNNVFAGLEQSPTDSGGVYISTNNGTSWINWNQGFNFKVTIQSLLIANNYIFAGTFGRSVWRRSLSEIIGIQNISTETPSKYSLSQNYPNPFNPTTNIKFSIIKTEQVKLIVYDIQGREVQTLVNESLKPGKYEAAFDASTLNSGVYFYKLITNGFTETKKMLLIK